jgi:predicted nucleic acid-binding protein
MILIDSNVPMYLVGTAHRNREAARRALEEAVASDDFESGIMTAIARRAKVLAET